MYNRLIEDKLRTALTDTPVILLSGPRQSGKTTLCRRFAPDRAYLTLDDHTTLQAAQSDPTSFVRQVDTATIDEIQRAPDLLLAIKDSVDRDRRPGRFLLTGSSNLLNVPTNLDSLAGRMEELRLLPLGQAEILGHSVPAILVRAFQGKSPVAVNSLVGNALVDKVLTGGYPDALARNSWARRHTWADNYINALIQRDVRDISATVRLEQMPRLLKTLAVHSAQLSNFSGIGAKLGMNGVTTRSYTTIFEQLFLLKTLEAWHNNSLKRLIKTPKLHFLDTGLLSAVRGLTPEIVARDRTVFGPILESFVVAEILKIADWSEPRFRFSHYRDKDGAEVDLVIENAAGDIVGIEVKASATVGASDFTGLKRLEAAVGDRLKQGLVLHDHDRVTPFGPRLWAAPISCLWE